MLRPRLILLLLFFTVADFLPAQLYRPVDKSSSVTTSIKNVGMATEGRLTGLEGEIRFNPADLKNAMFSVSVSAASINTDIDIRDSTLRGKAYLDAENNPRISFVSKQITQPAKSGPYYMKGTLTLKGISKDINFPFTVMPKTNGLQFTGEMRIYRHDFKIGEGSMVLSDNMTIALSVFAEKN